MPTFEYCCDDCHIIFEELLIALDEVKQYSKEHPCKKCGKPAHRIPSAANFNFAGKGESDPTHRMSSGVHDLDYPTLDKAVGRSANRKWKSYDAEKSERDVVRRRTGEHAISIDPGTGKPMSADSSTIKIREQALKTFKKIKDKAAQK